MPAVRARALPRSVSALRRLRKTLSAAAMIAAAAGILASLDALVDTFRTPEGVLPVACSVPALISGEIDQNGSRPGLQIRIQPQDDGLTASGLSLDRQLFSDKVQWSAFITAVPEAVGRTYTVTAGASDVPNPLAKSWTVSVLPSQDEVNAASHSLFLRFAGWNPLTAAFTALIVAASACILYFLLSYFGAKWLARRGLVRVYHTRDEGDDTVLYCIDPEALLQSGTSYPVLTARGQMLGLAEVTNRGTRYCVLRLSAAQARTGCFVAVQTSPEPIDI